MILNKNKHYTATVEKVLPFGNGALTLEGKTILVPNVLVGEVIRFKLIRLEKKKGIGKCIKIIKEAPERVKAPCVIASRCGGCQIQHLSIDGQLARKLNLLKEQLPKDTAIEIIKSENETHYRNKIQLSFQNNKDGFVCGLNKTNSNEVIDMKSCLIVNENINEVLVSLREWMSTLPSSTPLAHLVIRHSNKNEIMVGLIVSSSTFREKNSFVSAIKTNANVKSILLNINPTSNETILGPTTNLLYGKETISDTCLGLYYPISLNTFVQNNPVMTETIYTYVGELIKPLKPTLVWDLYCGIGILTQYLAKFSTTTLGVELVKESIKNATLSSKDNECKNVSFVSQDVKEFLGQTQDTPQVVVLDPPRKGCDKDVLASLIEKKIDTIVYISCSPQSLGRDSKIIIESGYTIESVKAFDCFTHTIHVETVVCFKLAS
ncbi:23S rRNA (uracil(1939)-C(5))-methyltransferase RlmD [Candidatus Marinamargulisbacteria bacterium SCGC AAA071-K20]|nr:23S rRNA (uracil(1939)-C(5))-methyltransferase RlmD [Candidatus Marinamargulisbacteria bacterium SCGC AAA071-K20]